MTTDTTRDTEKPPTLRVPYSRPPLPLDWGVDRSGGPIFFRKLKRQLTLERRRVEALRAFIRWHCGPAGAHAADVYVSKNTKGYEE